MPRFVLGLFQKGLGSVSLGTAALGLQAKAAKGLGG